MRHDRIAIVLILAAVGICDSSVAFAESVSTSGALVLEQPTGARSLGMGEAFVAVADDDSALYWNQAGLARLSSASVSAGYVMGLAETAYEQVAYAQCLGTYGGVGVGLNMFQGGVFERDNGEKISAQSDLVVTAGYGLPLTEKLSAGVGLKFFRSTLVETYTATAVAGDLGLRLSLAEGLTAGVSLQNFGTEVKYLDEGDALPLTLRLGGAYQANLAPAHTLLLAADWVKVNDAEAAAHLGMEYVFNRMLSARLGYKTGSDLEGLTAGLGFAWNMFQLDYAFGLVQKLDSLHRVTLSARF